MRILGIDPGTHIIGYGMLQYHSNGTYESEAYGTLQIPPKTPLPIALQSIYDDMNILLTTLQPDIMVVEQLFFFKNVSTAMSVAHARGVIVLSGQMHSIAQTEYTPLQVKMTLTGYGRAKKIEVQEMVKDLLHLEKIPKPDDAADALALAITHAHYLPGL